MLIKNIVEEDFTNYKICSMFIGFPTCTFKCEKECGCVGMCQNSDLVNSPNLDISIDAILQKYINNPISGAVVLGGLEPLDSPDDLIELIENFRCITNDPVIIYTGYYKHEVPLILEQLSKYNNIIIKFGRYIPNQTPHYDEVLGINLASDNQYAERIS